MDLLDFKKQHIKKELGILEDYGKVLSFVDFGNVNNWFRYDRQSWDNRELAQNESIEIDVRMLKDFSDLFSEKVRCYYGKDLRNKKSIAFDYVLETTFGKHSFVSKDLQRIKHYVDLQERDEKPKYLEIDKEGKAFIEIRKCNFDVEISVDAIKKINQYDTFCLFSGDADFVYLNNFLKKRGKKIILIKAGHITSKLRESADLVINAQNIKKNIAQIKQRPD